MVILWVPNIRPCVLTCGSAEGPIGASGSGRRRDPPESTCAAAVWWRCRVGLLRPRCRRAANRAAATVSDRVVLIGSPHEDARPRPPPRSRRQWFTRRWFGDLRGADLAAGLRARFGFAWSPDPSAVTIVSDKTPQVSVAGSVFGIDRFFTTALTTHVEPDEVVTDLATVFGYVIEQMLPAAFHNTGQYASSRERQPEQAQSLRANALMQNLRRTTKLGTEDDAPLRAAVVPRTQPNDLTATASRDHRQRPAIRPRNRSLWVPENSSGALTWAFVLDRSV